MKLALLCLESLTELLSEGKYDSLAVRQKGYIDTLSKIFRNRYKRASGFERFVL